MYMYLYNIRNIYQVFMYSMTSWVSFTSLIIKNNHSKLLAKEWQGQITAETAKTSNIKAFNDSIMLWNEIFYRKANLLLFNILFITFLQNFYNEKIEIV